MQKHKFTIITQLHNKNNSEIIEYVESSRKEYAKALRETFYAIRHNSFHKSKYKQYLQHKYNILARTANSIISEAQGCFNTLKALKKLEQTQLDRKINHLENIIIPKLVEQRNKNSNILKIGGFVSLHKQRNLRLKIVAKKAKLNRLKQKLNTLNYQLKSGRLKFCFGTKYLLKRDYNRFIEQRDNQISFIGTKEETSGNQILQLVYHQKNNQFLIKLRKDFGGYKSTKDNNKYAHGKVYCKYHKTQLSSILKTKISPLSYKIIKKNNRYYLHCTFEIHRNKNDFITSSNYGTIGLDFNKGFVTLSETNKYGHLIQTKLLPYRFKSGNKTKTDLQNIAKYVTTLAHQKGKDVCIENLDFKTKKAKTETRQGKKYNEIIHSLAYRKFCDIIENTTYRNQINLTKVNPAWTSWLARKLYCPIMKLNVHVGASYVIARRGQGYKDTVI